MNQEEQAKKMRRVIVKAWKDEAFKQRLLADPAAVLEGEGVEIPGGLDVRVVEDTGSRIHLVIPAPPPVTDALSDEQLDHVAGGFIFKHN